MENAIEIWKQLELPPLKIKAPWYGYELGYWSERNREEAELALLGKHFEIGERAKRERKKLDSVNAHIHPPRPNRGLPIRQNASWARSGAMCC